jgi:flagellar hook-associated protein 1 FlgK
MIPAFTGLETALRGLTAAQAAIDTTSHNIANANTPGYSRQEAVLTASPPLTIPAMSTVTGGGAQLGSGVDVTSINRIRDQFLDIQYRAQNSNTGNSSTTSTILQQVQTALAEPSSNGLSTQLGKLWQAWSDLANAPTSTAARQAVVDAGTTVAGTLNAIDQQLATVQQQTAQQYATLTASPSGTVHTAANQIAALNAQISQAQQAGQSPNDLLDQRDKLIDTLSGLANVSVNTQANGMVQVKFGNATNPLVNGTTVNWPQTLTPASSTTPGPGGQLGALLSLSDTTSGQIQSYRNSLSNVATQLAGQVNALQPASPFFSVGTPNAAGTIKVVATPSSVQSTATGNAGANELALALAGLNGQGADQSYSGFVSQVGSDVQSIQSTHKTGQSLLSAIDGQRQSTSGVSLDEEMTHLITFQRAYQASARVMSVMDSVIGSLLSAVAAG